MLIRANIPLSKIEYFNLRNCMMFLIKNWSDQYGWSMDTQVYAGKTKMMLGNS